MLAGAYLSSWFYRRMTKSGIAKLHPGPWIKIRKYEDAVLPAVLPCWIISGLSIGVISAMYNWANLWDSCDSITCMAQSFDLIGAGLVFLSVLALWWFLVCYLVQLSCKDTCLQQGIFFRTDCMLILQLIGGYLVLLLSSVMLIWTLMFFIIVVFFNIEWNKYLYVVIGLLEFAFAIFATCWKNIIRSEIPLLKNDRFFLFGFLWGFILWGPAWVYYMIVHDSVMQILNGSSVNQETIVKMSFIIAVNGVVFSACRKLQQRITGQH